MKIPGNCKLCKDIVDTRTQIVYGYGNEKATIMFVGICPGNHMLRGGADKSGIPFKGDVSGHIFEKMLKDIGLTREDVYTTNLVKCRPATKDRMYNRLPEQQEIFNCLPYLYDEIRHIKPKMVICLGKLVYHSILEKEENIFIKLYHWHPGFIARSPEFYGKWVENIRYDIQKWTKKRYLQQYLEEY